MKILSWFPKPKELTELTLLSKFEIIIYGLLLIITSFLYYRWTIIPVKLIDIQTDRIDKHTLYTGHYKDSIIADVGFISLTFHFSDFFNDQTDIMSSSFYTDQLIPKRHVNDHIETEHTTYTDYAYLDSLWNLYDSLCNRYNRQPATPMFYQRIITQFDEIRLQSLFSKEKQYKPSPIIYNPAFTKSSIITKKGKTLIAHEGFGATFETHEKIGALNKPSFFDLHDISQCYYQVDVHTQLINQLNLALVFVGANDFTFIDVEPDSIKGQMLFFCCQNNHATRGVKQHFTFHVYSKELAGKQQARMFIVTTILSALITIFLAFIIIYGYRKTKSFFYEKDKIQIEKIVKNSKNKHKKYKSRKSK